MYRTGTRFPAEYVCPITQEVMSDPVMISETGQVQSRASVLSALRCKCALVKLIESHA